MSCPLCGAPSLEGVARCPQCGWAPPGAPPAFELADLPVYGQPSATSGAVLIEPAEDAPSAVAPPPHRRSPPVLLVAALVAVVAVVVGIGVWTPDGGTEAEVLDTGDRFALPAGVTREPAEAWRTDLSATSMLGVGDVVVASSATDGSVVGLDVRDGEQRWRVTRPPGVAGVPSVARLGADRVLVRYEPRDHGDGSLRAEALDVDDGRVVWRHSGPTAEFATPVGGIVLVLSIETEGMRADLTMLDPDDGTVRGRVDGFPVGIGEDTLYVNDDRELVSIDTSTGRVRWRKSTVMSFLQATPVEVAGTLVTARSARVLVGYSADDGAFLWSRTVDDSVHALRAVGDVVVAIGGEDAFAVEPEDGTIGWHGDPDDWSGSPLVRVDGLDGAFVLGNDVVRVDPDRGDRVADAPAGDHPDSFTDETRLARGLIYVIGDADELVALDLQDLDQRWSIEVGGAITQIAAADDTVVVSTDDELIAYR